MKEILHDYYDDERIFNQSQKSGGSIKGRDRALKEIILALALCHNVTPVFNEDHTEK